jgi:hypothetical protein
MMRSHITLQHSALLSSGMGKESYSVGRHARSTDGGMLLLRLFEDPHARGTSNAVHITLDAVTAYNLGSVLMQEADKFLDSDRHYVNDDA